MTIRASQGHLEVAFVKDGHAQKGEGEEQEFDGEGKHHPKIRYYPRRTPRRPKKDKTMAGDRQSPVGDSLAWHVPLQSFVFFARFVDETRFSGSLEERRSPARTPRIVRYSGYTE
jgi:hypothetical protein